MNDILKWASNFLESIGNFGKGLGILAFVFIGLYVAHIFFTKHYSLGVVNDRKQKFTFAIVAAGVINFILFKTASEAPFIWCLIIFLVITGEMVANILWVNWKPEGTIFSLRLLGHLLLHIILSFHLMGTIARFYHPSALGKGFLNSWFGSFIAGWAWFLPVIGLIAIFWLWFGGLSAVWVTGIAAIVAFGFVVLLLWGCRWKDEVQGSETTKTTEATTTDPTEGSEADEDDSEATDPNPTVTVPTEEEVEALTLEQELLQEALTENGLVDIELNSDYLPHEKVKERKFEDAVSFPFKSEEDSKAADELFEELKVNPVLEGNVLIALRESEFFSGYKFVGDYFNTFMDKDGHILINNEVEGKKFTQERNTYTLQELVVLKAFNEVKIIEGRETEKVVRLHKDDYLTGKGFNLNGIQLKLEDYEEKPEHQKYLVLKYYKKNGESCSLIFDMYDKAFVILKEKPKKPKATATPTPSPIVTEKIKATPTPVITEKIKATPTPKVTEKVTPSPTQVEKVTPSPTPIVTEVITPSPTSTPKPTPTPTSTPTPTATPTPTSTPTPTATPTPTKDPSQGVTGTPVAPPVDITGPGTFTGTETGTDTSTAQEDDESTDYDTTEEYYEAIGDLEPEPTTPVTPIVTQTEECETGKPTTIEGKIDDQGTEPETPGQAPIDYGTPTQAPPKIDGEGIINDPENPAGTVGPPAD